jgi:D-alanyl-D-alanine carboxypeptidase (penicillin-binding protein 5/6)
MALAGRAFLEDPVLAEVANTPRFSTWTGLSMKNGNQLLSLYPGAYGVKIGFTDNAQQTIVAAAQRDGRDVIVSLLGSNNRYPDVIALLDWTFSSLPAGCPG